MTKILIISTNNETFSNISAILNASGIENALYTRMDDDEIFDFIKENNFGAVILDDEIETYSVIAKKIKNNFFSSSLKFTFSKYLEKITEKWILK